MRVCTPLLALAIFASILTPACCAPPRYAITDLGSLGGNQSYATAISEDGEVFGQSRTGQIDSSGYPVTHAFGWWSGGIRDLGSLGGSSSVMDVDSLGRAVGYSHLQPESSERAVLWDTISGISDLGTLGGQRSLARGINNAGQVVGCAQRADSAWHAFLWEDGSMVDLGTLGNTSSYAEDVNDYGQVVGFSESIGSNVDRPFVWGVDSGMQALAIGGIDMRRAEAINGQGQIAGHLVDGQGHWRACLWDSGLITNLGSLGGASFSCDINDSGEIVGWSFLQGTGIAAFLWQSETGMIDLNTLISHESQWVLREAKAVNNSGLIVGWGEFMGQDRAVLLTPVPEPSSLIALGALTTPLLALRRRKALSQSLGRR